MPCGTALAITIPEGLTEENEMMTLLLTIETRRIENQAKLAAQYDYARQCWIVDGKVARCGHQAGVRGCYACLHHGERVN